ncbi:MAG: SCO family protein [Sphingomonadales bacterium]|nr:SCO family protein [Sphingomonadales bacterium]MBD3774131.1 SCO family protein [Paracoccaceae bacterium]
MNRLAMPRNKLIFAAAIAFAVPLSLSACGSAGTQQGASGDGRPPLEGAKIGGPFELVDKDGKAVRWSDFAGKYRIVYFGYTYCPDVCPTDVQRMSQGLRLYAKDHAALADKIQPIFITVDPQRDTPAKVGEFAAAFSDKLIGLTGTPEQIASAAKTFRVFYSKGETSPGGGYLVDHSSITYLFGPQGEPLATLPTDLGPEAVADELAKWVK